MADNASFFHDTRAPFITTDVAAVTLAATAKALYTTAVVPVFPASYFGFVGKMLTIKLFGKITTVLTPGNGSFDIYWGSGADATGTILASSAALALTASQTNLSWTLEFDVRCTALGATGALYCTGLAEFNAGVLATTLQPMMIPPSAAAAVTVDLTAANTISVQFKRSGSTAETMAVQMVRVTPLN